MTQSVTQTDNKGQPTECTDKDTSIEEKKQSKRSLNKYLKSYRKENAEDLASKGIFGQFNSSTNRAMAMDLAMTRPRSQSPLSERPAVLTCAFTVPLCSSSSNSVKSVCPRHRESSSLSGGRRLTMMMKMTGPAKPQMTPFCTLSQQCPSAAYLPEADASVMVTMTTGRPETQVQVSSI